MYVASDWIEHMLRNDNTTKIANRRVCLYMWQRISIQMIRGWAFPSCWWWFADGAYDDDNTTLTSQSSLLTFRQQLKTFLFEQSYICDIPSTLP